MSTTLHRIEERDVPTVSDARAASRVAMSAAGLLAALGVVVGIVGAHDRGRAIAWAALVLVAAFALSTLVNALARPREPMWMWLAGGTVAFNTLRKSFVPIQRNARVTSPLATCAARPVCWPCVRRPPVVAPTRPQSYS